MTRKAYISDATNAEWRIIEELLAIAQATGRPRQVDLREIVKGIFYGLRKGYSTIYSFVYVQRTDPSQYVVVYHLFYLV